MMIRVVVIKSDTTAIFSDFPVYFIKLSTKSESNSIYLPLVLLRTDNPLLIFITVIPKHKRPPAAD